jgi:hypothetical protein
VSDPNAQKPWPDEEPRSQAFQPMSYDLAPEYAAQPPPPPAQPPAGAPGVYPPQPGYGPPPQSHAPVPPPVVHQQPPYVAPVQPPAQPPKKKRSIGLPLVLVGLALLVTCGLTCGLGYPVLKEAGASVSAPSTLPGGLTKSTDPDLQDTMDDMESDLKSDISATEAVAGFYTDADQNQVIIVAAATILFFPENEVDSAFSGLKEANMNLVGITSYEAGKFGGYLKCGSGTSDAGDLTACVWTDHGSAGIGFFFKKTQEESASLFLKIRQEVESQS